MMCPTPFLPLGTNKRELTNEPISVLDSHHSPSPSSSGALSSEHLPLSENTLLPQITQDWDPLFSDLWISNETLANPNLYDFANLVPQVPNFALYPTETTEQKPRFLNSFPTNVLIPPDPFEPLNHSTLKRSNLGPFGNSENFIPPPQVSKNDKQPPFAQTLVDPVSPPLKRPNLGPFISPPEVSRNYKQTPFAETLAGPPVLKQPRFGQLGSMGSFDLVPEFQKLDKQAQETLVLVPQQVVYDQLYKACELILSGNLSNAHSILARLNHQLTPGTKPFQRASFYLKEALFQLPLLGPGSGSFPKSPTPVDGFFKMGAYKLLSEVSPFPHFVNFTSNQAILEAVGDLECIHVVDFDIGLGAQWASFMAEVPARGRNKGVTSFLKITAFASPSSHNPFELGLMHENLSQFASEIGLKFELEVVNLDGFDPNAYSVNHFKLEDKETAIAVNFPIWAFSNRLAALPSVIRFVKQLSPKVVVSMERGCDRTDLPFSHHLLHTLQYHEAVLDSIDAAANMNSEMVSKIEKFVIQPKIENIVMGRLSYPDQMPHWKALFAAAGFSQVSISNFAEIQAECVLAKTQIRGFNVGKKQASLVLSWQSRELVSASAWRC